MEPYVPYVVTKKSNDGTFRVGDHIRLVGDGAIVCREAQGWVDAQHVKDAVIGMEYEFDRESIIQEIDKLLKEVRRLNDVLVKNG